MRILWLLFITVLLVCGKSESFEEINDSDIKRATSTSNEDQEVENNLTSNPVYNFTRRKRSLDGEERIKKQQKFHSWGGKRSDDKDEEEKDEEFGEPNSFQYNDGEREVIDLNNQSLPRSFLSEENMLSYIQGGGFKGFHDNISQEDKRDAETTNDVIKRAHFYDSILRQVGFYPELSDQSSKRYPAFNSWAGKRSAAFNSWGGKRSAAFNSWGGKRKEAFNSWGGKRNAAFNSWGVKRAAPFNSWGGKRTPVSNNWGQRGSTSFNSWGGKRGAAFNSWGGKRAARFNSWGGKRTTAFNSWGGKRDSVDLSKWEEGESPLNHNSEEQINDSYKGTNYKNSRTNEQNYDATESTNSAENIKEKRVSAFNSWAGKRIPSINSPGGKKSAAFNSWGGKRSGSSFNSWGGKRSILNRLAEKITSSTSPDVVDTPAEDTSNHETSYDSSTIDHNAEDISTVVESNDLLRNLIGEWNRHKPNTEGFDGDQNKNNQFAGNEHEWHNMKVENSERSRDKNSDSNEEEINKRSNPAFSSWAGKRAPLFTPWYSNKTPPLLVSSGKRRPAFSSWGGKRSKLQPLQGTGCSYSERNKCQDFTETNLMKPNEKYVDGVLREKREVNCGTNGSISAYGRDCEGSRSKKMDEDLKKNRVMTRMLFQGGLSRPMAIKSLSRGIDFYAWGGKRSL